jgi:nicotinamidase-related amidase
MKEALIVIDVQNDYFPGGSCELHNSYEAEKVIIELIEESRSIDRPIIYIKHINAPNRTFFIEGTWGCEISERIKPAPSDKIITKHYPSAFFETDLQEYLSALGIEKLIICGMMTHMCVDTTVRAAKDFGYKVDLVEKACTTKDLTFKGEVIPAETVQKAFMASLQGTFANVI